MRTKLIGGMIFVLISLNVCIAGSSGSDSGEVDPATLPDNFVSWTMAICFDENSLSAVSLDQSYKDTDMDIALYERAIIEIIPAKSGNLMLYEKYPGGRIVNYGLGYFNANEPRYFYFVADSQEGVHELWYNINQQDSNHVYFHVTSHPSDVTKVSTNKDTYNHGESIRLCYNVLCEGNVELTIVRFPSSYYSSKHIGYIVDGTPSQQSSYEQVATYGPFWRTPGEYCMYLDGSYNSGRYLVILKTDCGTAVCSFVVL